MEKRIIYTSNVAKIEYLEVPKEEMDSSANQFSDTMINGFSMKVASTSNGILVETEGSYFLLYKSIKDLDKVLSVPPGESSIFWGLNPYFEKALSYKSDVISKLFQKLEVEKNLQFNLDGIKLLDEKIQPLRVDDTFVEQYFFAIYLYLGEVIIHCNGGKWQMQYNKDENFWFPYLYSKEDIQIDLGPYLFETLDNMREDKIHSPFLFVYNLVIDNLQL